MQAKFFAGLLAGLMASAVCAANAQEFKAGDLTIVQPWSRATPKGSPVAAGYLVIHNDGKTADRLLSGTSDLAREVQVHEMTMDGGVMKMRQLTGGLEIPPGATVELKPGGYHMMFMDIKSPFTQGETIKVTLTFEHAGKAPVDFKVGGLGDTGPAKAGGGMKMDGGAMDMKH